MSLDALFARRTLGIRPGLDVVRHAYEALGRPGSAPAIHIVGTNGKGSIASMAEHALRARGHRTGLFTSPHLQRVTERVRVDGREVDDEILEAAIAWVLQMETDDQPRPLSFFEVLTLAALVVFDQSGVEVVVAEAGLGGRLDTTRLVDARAIGVAAIDLDHQEYLGDTLTMIAAEKAAVFRSRVPVYSVPQHPEVEVVLQQMAREVHCPVRRCDPIEAPLRGAHQGVNAAVALALAQTLDPSVTEADLQGTRWPGRLEIRAAGAGQWVLDVAHNPAAMRGLAAELARLPSRDTTVLVARAADKDGPQLAKALQSVGRCWSVRDEALGLHPLPGARVFEGVADPDLDRGLAAQLARGGRIVVCGSHRLVGAALTRWLDEPSRIDPSDPR